MLPRLVPGLTPSWQAPGCCAKVSSRARQAPLTFSTFHLEFCAAFELGWVAWRTKAAPQDVDAETPLP